AGFLVHKKLCAVSFANSSGLHQVRPGMVQLAGEGSPFAKVNQITHGLVISLHGCQKIPSIESPAKARRPLVNGLQGPPGRWQTPRTKSENHWHNGSVDAGTENCGRS